MEENAGLARRWPGRDPTGPVTGPGRPCDVSHHRRRWVSLRLAVDNGEAMARDGETGPLEDADGRMGLSGGRLAAARGR